MTLPAALAALNLATNALKNAKKNPKKENKVQQKLMNHPKTQKSGYKSPAMSGSIFAQVLSDPFAPSSIGCKVPDPFPFPTVSYHMHQTTVLGTSGTDTSGGVMFLPSPIFSLVDTNHMNDATKNSVISSSFTRYSSTSTNLNYGLLASTGLGSLSDVLESYRVVSWGIKISNLQPELSATGRLMIAFLPIGDTVPTYADINSTAFLVAGITPITGVPASALNSSAILQLPTALEFTVGDLLRGDIELSGMYTNSVFWSFKVPAAFTTMFTSLNVGDEVGVNSTGVASQATTGYKDSTRMNGGVGIVLYYEGIPLTTSAFQVETIYHLEGTPSITSSSATKPSPSNTCKPYPGTSAEVDKGLSAVNGIDKVVKFVDRGANFLNKNKKSMKSLMTVARSVLA